MEGGRAESLMRSKIRIPTAIYSELHIHARVCTRHIPDAPRGPCLADGDLQSTGDVYWDHADTRRGVNRCISLREAPKVRTACAPVHLTASDQPPVALDPRGQPQLSLILGSALERLESVPQRPPLDEETVHDGPDELGRDGQLARARERLDVDEFRRGGSQDLRRSDA